MTRSEVGLEHSTWSAELELFRREKDEFFAGHPQSPLTAEQRRKFRGLAYFPANAALVLETELTAPPNPHEQVRMATTGGSEQIYRRVGVVRFDVDGEPAQLTLFASEGGDGLFLPFRDATSGRESYGAGRYLDIDAPENGRVLVDLNLAYNPYCAYNDAWTCPLPPSENWLRVPIRAGERDFSEHEAG